MLAIVAGYSALMPRYKPAVKCYVCLIDVQLLRFELPPRVKAKFT